jgi:HSP20 family molecular chaperone IbpA
MATALDPFDFDSYLLDRLAEFFGPDFGPFMKSVAAIPSIPSGTVAAGARRRPFTIEESPDEWPGQAVEQAEQLQPSAGRRGARPAIAVDVAETENSYLVEASVPGIPKDHISVTVDHNNVLTIETQPVDLLQHACQMQHSEASSKFSAGEKYQQTTAAAAPPNVPATPAESPKKPMKEESKGAAGSQKDRKVLLSERQKGAMRRAVRLPKYADAKNVKTCLESGVLCLCFAKLPSQQVQHKIELS